VSKYIGLFEISKICAEPITGDQRETHVEYFHLVTTPHGGDVCRLTFVIALWSPPSLLPLRQSEGTFLCRITFANGSSSGTTVDANNLSLYK